MAFNTGPNPVSEPPRYNNMDTISGDLLYRSPVMEAAPTHWSPTSAQPLTSPNQAYMGYNDHDRYIEQPVVPSPVPRTPKMTSSGAIYSPGQGSNAGSPTSPTGYRGNSNSLSPMPSSRSPTQPRSHLLDSAPIIAVATRGSPAQAHQQAPYQQQQQQQTLYPSQQRQREALYNSNESGDQIMTASRGSVTVGKSVGLQSNNVKTGGVSPQHPMRINTVVAQEFLDQRSKSPAPSVPIKSPYRHPIQLGQMSPPTSASVRTPTSPSTGYYRG